MSHRILLGEDSRDVDTQGTTITVRPPEGDAVAVEIHHRSEEYLVETPSGLVRADASRDRDALWVRWRGRTYRLTLDRGGRKKSGGGGSGSMSSPMPGQLVKFLVEPGATVKEGEPLLVVEAMKMQLEIKASHGGTVTRFLAAEGDQVDAGVDLVELAGEPS